MAGPRGFEPLTSGSAGQRPILARRRALVFSLDIDFNSFIVYSMLLKLNVFCFLISKILNLITMFLVVAYLCGRFGRRCL